MQAIPVDFHSEWSRRAAVGGARVSDIRYPPKRACPMHRHDHPSLGIVLDGEIRKRFTHSAMHVEQHRGFTMPAGILHSDDFRSGSRVVVIEMDQSHPVTIERLSVCQSVFDRHRILHDARLGALGQRLAGAIRRADSVSPLAIDALVSEILSVAAGSGDIMSTTPSPPWLTRAHELAARRTGRRMTVAEMAAEAGGIHPAYLARRFREVFGEPPGAFARSARLQWAAEQLVLTDREIAEIAIEAGFADQSHFTRAFRRYLGQTPARFRKLYRRERNE